MKRKKKMDQSKKQWEHENRELRRKAALGWMLGCLSGWQSSFLNKETKLIVRILSIWYLNGIEWQGCTFFYRLAMGWIQGLKLGLCLQSSICG